jgi:hypothetical protein
MDSIHKEKRRLSKNYNKSFLSIQENEKDFIDILKDKSFLSINFNNNSIPLIVSKKSVFKIINLLTDKEIVNSLEINLANYIICYLSDENMSFNIVDESSCNSSILELPYQKLFDQTNQYAINIVDSNITSKNNLLSYFSTQKKKIIIKSKSINKICNYLNITLYKFADYIHITIISFQEQDKFKNLIKKSRRFSFSASFLGVKRFETDYEIPARNFKNPIYKLNDIFDQILGKIEDDSSDKDSSDISAPKSHSSLSESHSQIMNNTNNSINISSSINNPVAREYIDEKDFERECLKNCECQNNRCPNCLIF